jgi:transposase-like protein
MSTSIILKQDELGRVRVTPQRADELVAEYQRSGLTLASFAAQVGVAYKTFWYWLKKRGLTGSLACSMKPAVSPSKAAEFVEVAIQTPRLSLVVELPGGARATLQDERQAPLVAALIQALHSTAVS